MKKAYKDYFISDINKGPFKSLKEKHKGKDSAYIVSRYYQDNSNLVEKDIYELAVDQAYLDMCRTLSIKNNPKVKKNITEFKTIIAKELKIYFACPNNNCWINSFLALDENIENGNNNDIQWEYGYGKLQKIVNMSFKYLYCCNDIRFEKNKAFKRCHMPLDRLILSWMLEWIKDNYADSYKIYRDKAWSKLEREEYLHIQKLIKERRKKEQWCCSVLEKEFEVWIKQKNIAVIQEIKSCLDACDNRYFNCKIKGMIPSFDDFNDTITSVDEYIKNN